MIHCIYHVADKDGHLSGAIVGMAHKWHLNFIGVDYGWTIDFGSLGIDEGDTVFIVDFSLSKEKMIELGRIANVIWIDHHKSAIEELSSLKVKGSREIGKAACYLVWKWFYPHKEVPVFVELVSDYDVWNIGDENDFENKVLNFQYGLRLHDTDPKFEDSRKIWEGLVYGDSDFEYSVFYNIVNEGKVIRKFIDKENKIKAKSSCFERTINGYSCLLINQGFTNASIFNCVKNDSYDFLIAFSRRKNFWRYTVFANKDTVDASVFAKLYSGGGHKGAAGFTSQDLLFV